MLLPSGQIPEGMIQYPIDPFMVSGQPVREDGCSLMGGNDLGEGTWKDIRNIRSYKG